MLTLDVCWGYRKHDRGIGSLSVSPYEFVFRLTPRQVPQHDFARKLSQIGYEVVKYKRIFLLVILSVRGNVINYISLES